jgi:hypothetical protein
MRPPRHEPVRPRGVVMAKEATPLAPHPPVDTRLSADPTDLHRQQYAAKITRSSGVSLRLHGDAGRWSHQGERVRPATRGGIGWRADIRPPSPGGLGGWPLYVDLTHHCTGLVQSDSNIRPTALACSKSGAANAPITKASDNANTATAAARHQASAIGAPTSDKQDTFTINVDDAHSGVTGVPVTVTISTQNTAPTVSDGTPVKLLGVATYTPTQERRRRRLTDLHDHDGADQGHRPRQSECLGLGKHRGVHGEQPHSAGARQLRRHGVRWPRRNRSSPRSTPSESWIGPAHGKWQ